MSLPRILARALAVLVLVVAGCGGCKAKQTASPAAPSLPGVSSPSPLNCPRAGPAAVQWPAGIPANFPKPPGGRILSVRDAADGVRIVRLSTEVSLRDGVLFVLRELPRAGYALGRGDAESGEADAPFRGGDVRGVIRLSVIDSACRTYWLVAVVRPGATPGTTPLLPRPRVSSSPLPFG